MQWHPTPPTSKHMYRQSNTAGMGTNKKSRRELLLVKAGHMPEVHSWFLNKRKIFFSLLISPPTNLIPLPHRMFPSLQAWSSQSIQIQMLCSSSLPYDASALWPGSFFSLRLLVPVSSDAQCHSDSQGSGEAIARIVLLFPMLQPWTLFNVTEQFCPRRVISKGQCWMVGHIKGAHSLDLVQTPNFGNTWSKILAASLTNV